LCIAPLLRRSISERRCFQQGYEERPMPERIDVKYCRHCGQLIPLRAVTCPYCEKETIKGEEQKECPFCGELIKANAVKCKHCREFVDGRERGGQPGQVIIERAIFASGTPEGGIELHRPDGTRVSLSAADVARLGQPPPGRALPDGRSGQEPPQRAVPMQGALPAERRLPGAEPPPPVPQAQEPSAGVVPPVEARYECPSCKRYVYEGDAFCENCGRDLSRPSGEPSVPVQPKHYGPVDYALMVSAGAPLGLLSPFPFSAVVAAAGIALGAWCLLRILLSGGRLKGTRQAVGAIALGLFWMVIICWSAA